MKISEILEPGTKEHIDTAWERVHSELTALLQQRNKLALSLRAWPTQAKEDELDALEDKIYHLKQKLEMGMGPKEKVWQLLKTECSEILEILKSQQCLVLFRGVRDTPSAVFQGNGRKNRRPKDSTHSVSQVFNYCLQHLGFPARRDNSTFVTTNSRLAEEFGNVYMIFPKNGFKFTYTAHNDMVLSTDEIDTCVDIEKIESTLEEIVVMSKDVNTDLPADIARIAGSRHEPVTLHSFMMDIMSLPPQLVAQFKQATTVDLDWKHFVDLKKFQRIYEPKQKDLSAALRSGTEIYILGEYIALDASKFQESIRNLMQTDL